MAMEGMINRAMNERTKRNRIIIIMHLITKQQLFAEMDTTHRSENSSNCLLFMWIECT